MDQINNNPFDGDIRQFRNNNMSYHYSMNYADQYFEENNQQTNEDEQNENESISMPIVYKKRVRTKFNQEQLDVLEATFQQHHYPTVDIIDDLVEQLNLPTQKVTIWFQNRRARLKKTQQKLDIQPSLENDTQQQQYDSGIHLDEDVSHDSPASPPPNPTLHLPPLTSFMINPSSCYLPNSSYPFYNPMWTNFNYPSAFQSSAYHLMNYNSTDIPSSFMFQDISNYQHSNEFNGEL